MARELDEAEQKQLERTMHNLSLQRPGNELVGQALDSLRDAAKAFAVTIYYNAPPSLERSIALTEIESATQWAIGAVVRNQED